MAATRFGAGFSMPILLWNVIALRAIEGVRARFYGREPKAVTPKEGKRRNDAVTD
jgi:hypothetical protein